jgi:hypothetical protein
VLQHLPCAYDDTIEGQWSVREDSNPNTGGPKRTPCGEYQLQIDGSHFYQRSFDRPCTENANAGSWLALPFQNEGKFVPCGIKHSGGEGSPGYNTCPGEQVIHGKFEGSSDFGQPPQVITDIGDLEATPCGEYEMQIDGSHIFQRSFDRPCTDNANAGSWLALPFQNEGKFVPCGIKLSGGEGSTGYNTCPGEQVIHGKFEVGEKEEISEISLGSVTACVDRAYRDRFKNTDTEICTGNANQASWLRGPFLEDGTIILCGLEVSGERGGGRTRHASCPRRNRIRGVFDTRPVDESFGNVVRNICDGFSFTKGDHGGRSASGVGRLQVSFFFV